MRGDTTLDELRIDYKINNKDVNLYWKKNNSTLDDLVRDVNSFVHHKLQLPYRLVMIEGGHHVRSSREARMYRTMVYGREFSHGRRNT